MRNALFILLLFLSASFAPQEDEIQYHSAFNGLKLSETPFGDYIKEELPGTNIVLVVSYGCSHCWDAPIAISKLQKENLLNSVVVLGTGTADEKADFRKETKTAYKMLDYDFDTLKTAIKIRDPQLPPPPFALLVKDNVIQTVFVEMPSVKQFRAINSR